MNEKYTKGVVTICFLACVFIIVAQSIAYDYTVRRKDTEINNLVRDLGDARERIAFSTRETEDCRRTIKQCYDSIGTIADNLGRGNDELSDVIEGLKVVREEIEVLENNLDFFYIKYGYHHDDNRDNDGDIE